MERHKAKQTSEQSVVGSGTQPTDVQVPSPPVVEYSEATNRESFLDGALLSTTSSPRKEHILGDGSQRSDSPIASRASPRVSSPGKGSPQSSSPIRDSPTWAGKQQVKDSEDSQGSPRKKKQISGRTPPRELVSLRDSPLSLAAEKHRLDSGEQPGFPSREKLISYQAGRRDLSQNEESPHDLAPEKQQALQVTGQQLGSRHEQRGSTASQSVSFSQGSSLRCVIELGSGERLIWEPPSFRGYSFTASIVASALGSAEMQSFTRRTRRTLRRPVGVQVPRLMYSLTETLRRKVMQDSERTEFLPRKKKASGQGRRRDPSPARESILPALSAEKHQVHGAIEEIRRWPGSAEQRARESPASGVQTELIQAQGPAIKLGDDHHAEPTHELVSINSVRADPPISRGYRFTASDVAKAMGSAEIQSIISGIPMMLRPSSTVQFSSRSWLMEAFLKQYQEAGPVQLWVIGPDQSSSASSPDNANPDPNIWALPDSPLEIPEVPLIEFPELQPLVGSPSTPDYPDLPPDVPNWFALLTGDDDPAADAAELDGILIYWDDAVSPPSARLLTLLSKMGYPAPDHPTFQRWFRQRMENFFRLLPEKEQSRLLGLNPEQQKQIKEGSPDLAATADQQVLLPKILEVDDFELQGGDVELNFAPLSPQTRPQGDDAEDRNLFDLDFRFVGDDHDDGDPQSLLLWSSLPNPTEDMEWLERYANHEADDEVQEAQPASPNSPRYVDDAADLQSHSPASDAFVAQSPGTATTAGPDVDMPDAPTAAPGNKIPTMGKANACFELSDKIQVPILSADHPPAGKQGDQGTDAAKPAPAHQFYQNEILDWMRFLIAMRKRPKWWDGAERGQRFIGVMQELQKDSRQAFAVLNPEADARQPDTALIAKLEAATTRDAFLALALNSPDTDFDIQTIRQWLKRLDDMRLAPPAFQDTQSHDQFVDVVGNFYHVLVNTLRTMYGADVGQFVIDELAAQQRDAIDERPRPGAILPPVRRAPSPDADPDPGSDSDPSHGQGSSGISGKRQRSPSSESADTADHAAKKAVHDHPRAVQAPAARSVRLPMKKAELSVILGDWMKTMFVMREGRVNQEVVTSEVFSSLLRAFYVKLLAKGPETFGTVEVADEQYEVHRRAYKLEMAQITRDRVQQRLTWTPAALAFADESELTAVLSQFCRVSGTRRLNWSGEAGGHADALDGELSYLFRALVDEVKETTLAILGPARAQVVLNMGPATLELERQEPFGEGRQEQQQDEDVGNEQQHQQQVAPADAQQHHQQGAANQRQHEQVTRREAARALAAHSDERKQQLLGPPPAQAERDAGIADRRSRGPGIVAIGARIRAEEEAARALADAADAQQQHQQGAGSPQQQQQGAGQQQQPQQQHQQGADSPQQQQGAPADAQQQHQQGAGSPQQQQQGAPADGQPQHQQGADSPQQQQGAPADTQQQHQQGAGSPQQQQQWAPADGQPQHQQGVGSPQQQQQGLPADAQQQHQQGADSPEQQQGAPADAQPQHQQGAGNQQQAQDDAGGGVGPDYSESMDVGGGGFGPDDSESMDEGGGQQDSGEEAQPAAAALPEVRAGRRAARAAGSRARGAKMGRPKGARKVQGPAPQPQPSQDAQHPVLVVPILPNQQLAPIYPPPIPRMATSNQAQRKIIAATFDTRPQGMLLPGMGVAQLFTVQEMADFRQYLDVTNKELKRLATEMPIQMLGRLKYVRLDETIRASLEFYHNAYYRFAAGQVSHCDPECDPTKPPMQCCYSRNFAKLLACPDRATMHKAMIERFIQDITRLLCVYCMNNSFPLRRLPDMAVQRIRQFMGQHGYDPSHNQFMHLEQQTGLPKLKLKVIFQQARANNPNEVQAARKAARDRPPLHPTPPLVQPQPPPPPVVLPAQVQPQPPPPPAVLLAQVPVVLPAQVQPQPPPPPAVLPAQVPVVLPGQAQSPPHPAFLLAQVPVVLPAHAQPPSPPAVLLAQVPGPFSPPPVVYPVQVRYQPRPRPVLLPQQAQPPPAVLPAQVQPQPAGAPAPAPAPAVAGAPRPHREFSTYAWLQPQVKEWLMSWIDSRWEYPFPTNGEKDTLSQLCGLRSKSLEHFLRKYRFHNRKNFNTTFHSGIHGQLNRAGSGPAAGLGPRYRLVGAPIVDPGFQTIVHNRPDGVGEGDGDGDGGDGGGGDGGGRGPPPGPPPGPGGGAPGAPGGGRGGGGSPGGAPRAPSGSGGASSSTRPNAPSGSGGSGASGGAGPVAQAVGMVPDVVHPVPVVPYVVPPVAVVPDDAVDEQAAPGESEKELLPFAGFADQGNPLDDDERTLGDLLPCQPAAGAQGREKEVLDEARKIVAMRRDGGADEGQESRSPQPQASGSSNQQSHGASLDAQGDHDMEDEADGSISDDSEHGLDDEILRAAFGDMEEDTSAYEGHDADLGAAGVYIDRKARSKLLYREHRWQPTAGDDIFDLMNRAISQYGSISLGKIPSPVPHDAQIKSLVDAHQKFANGIRSHCRPGCNLDVDAGRCCYDERFGDIDAIEGRDARMRASLPKFDATIALLCFTVINQNEGRFLVPLYAALVLDQWMVQHLSEDPNPKRWRPAEKDYQSFEKNIGIPKTQARKFYDSWRSRCWLGPRAHMTIPEQWTDAQSAVVSKWFEEHLDNPYVDEWTVVPLVQATQMSEEQVQWRLHSLRRNNRFRRIAKERNRSRFRPLQPGDDKNRRLYWKNIKLNTCLR